MIKFFRHIRKSLLEQNKMSKYFKYAIGEILLVVIGILIALQINNWKENRTLASKELSYLKDIKVNLQDDIKAIDSVLSFNEYKAIVTDSMFYTLSKYSNPEAYMPIIISYMYTLTEYAVFEPNRIAFSNMVAAQNIDLITNQNLKSSLSQYYKLDFNSTSEESAKQKAREFSDYVAEKAFNRQTLKALVNHNSSLKDISEVTIHKDPKVYALLFTMLMSTQSQSDVLIEAKKDIGELMKQIENKIEE